MKLTLQFIIATFIVLVIYMPAVHGQANLVFSGGNGTPISITLQNSVTYTTNLNCGNNGPAFFFDEAGNPFGAREVTGTMTFSINGGTALPIAETSSGFNRNDVSVNDIYVYRGGLNISSGVTVVLNAGTITTTENVAAAPPANGSYTTFLADGYGVRCGANGVAVTTTAASVSISGRVLTNSKRGLSNALVYLTDSSGDTRTARTNSLGYYRFEDVTAGQSVTITVASKRYQFAPQLVNVNEEMSGLNFLAEH
jgi:hypothetical protein